MSTAILTLPSSEVPVCAFEWLWRPYLARGRITILDGEPGVGKSHFATDLAARLSRGVLPDGQSLARPNVTLILSAEGDPSEAVRPRLIAAGADLSKVILAGTGGGMSLPQLPQCTDAIGRAIREHAVDLAILDPISAFLPREFTTSHQRVRDGLALLAGVARDTGCAILLVRHLTRGANAARGLGGSALFGLARTAMLVARHPEEPGLRVLAMTKAHLGPPPPALGFRLIDGESGSRVEWCGGVDLSAEEASVSQARQWSQRPRERAAEFLLAALANGPVAVAELAKLTAERGIAWRTLERARRHLKVSTKWVKEGSAAGWHWRLASSGNSGAARRSAILRDLPPLPDKPQAMHTLRHEGDTLADDPRTRDEPKAREAPEG
jgi:hypothetical protein